MMATVNTHNQSTMQGIHIVAKPIGPMCNLNCEYCFYLEKQALFGVNEKYRMTDDTLRAFVINYITVQPTPVVGSHSGFPAARYTSVQPRPTNCWYTNDPGVSLKSPVITAGMVTLWRAMTKSATCTAWQSRTVPALAAMHSGGHGMPVPLQGTNAPSPPEARCVAKTSTGPTG